MTDAARTTDPTDPAEAERRRRLRAKVFGDVLPETTSDERGEAEESATSEEWLRRQVPPHHG